VGALRSARVGGVQDSLEQPALPVRRDSVVRPEDGGDGADWAVGGVVRVCDGEGADQASLTDTASRQIDD
jgi:hypothetical protein